jgi:hypothetical protein
VSRGGEQTIFRTRHPVYNDSAAPARTPFDEDRPVTIGAECPHCETRFQLNRDLIGKSMRCPNPDCREVFVVSELAVASPTPEPTPDLATAPTLLGMPAVGTTAAVSDFLPVLEGGTVDVPLSMPPAPEPDVERVQAMTEPMLEAEPVPDDRPVYTPPVLKAQPLEAAPILKAAKLPEATRLPSPREVHWSDETAPPVGRPPERVSAAAEDEIPIRTRPTKSGLPRMIFVGLLTALVLVVGGTAGLFYVRGLRAEEDAAGQAQAMYEEGKFGEARKRFDELVATYPSSKDRDKYAFFGKLSGLKGSITAVTTRENPGPAVEQLRAFVLEHADSPLAQPNTGYGADVVQAGQSLCGTLNDHAADRVKAYRANRVKRKESELAAAEKAVAEGRGLIPVLERFRDKNGQAFDEVRAKYDSTEAEVTKEWKRLATLDPWRDLPNEPTDQLIARFEKEMRAAGLADDGEVQSLATAAKTKLRQLVLFQPDPAAAEPAPPASTTVTAFAPRVHESPAPKPVPEASSDAVFAVAKGVLYVLDAHTGRPLWADRVSTDPGTADAPLRFVSEDGSTDWLFVTSVLDGQAGLTARDTRTGAPVWHQPLPAPALGRPVRIGGRLFVGLKDDLGTLLQFDLTGGGQLSRCGIRQPIGGGLSALRGTRSSHGFLLVPADARRVFVFEVGKDADGPRKMPQVVRVLATDHPKDSLRGEPLVIDPDDPAAPRRMVLTQTDLPTTIKLRSFSLPDLAGLGVAQPEGDARPEQTAEVTVSGWTWFPPVSNGERVAVATDSGTFAVFGLNQPGNADKPLYQVPGKRGDGDKNLVTRGIVVPTEKTQGLVVSADEDSFWVVTGNQLARLRAAVDPTGGYRVAPQGNPLTVGEPIARGQVRPALNTGYLTVKTNESTSVHMLAFDLDTGDVRWRRQLGATAVAPPIPLEGGGNRVVDEAAGVYMLTNHADSELLDVVSLVDPLPAAVTAATVAVSGDRKAVWVVSSEPSRDGQNLVVRKFEGGKKASEATVPVPAASAGRPVLVGDQLILPLSNGFVYRIADGQSEQGPVWRGPNAKPDAVCHLTASGGTEFLASDGESRVYRWRWDSAQGKAEKAGGPWESAAAVTAPPLLFAVGGKEWLLVPDAGGVSAFDPTKPSAEAVRRWVGVANAMIPGGRVGHLTPVGAIVVCSVDGKAVIGIDPSKEQAEWGLADAPLDAGEVLGITATADTALVTYQTGHVREVRVKTGAITAEAARATGSPLAAAAVTQTGENRLLIPNTDGTVSRVPLEPKR